MNERCEFYQQHLNRVSRSFAFCIERLEGVLRERVALAYLICRILDTVEDAHWLDFSAQQQQFEKFNAFVQERPSAAQVTHWVTAFPGGVTDDERLLLADAHRILNDLHDLPGEDRQCLQSGVLSMSRGMQYFMSRKTEGVLKLKCLHEVNQYCFFVAGVVGEILTHLVRMSPDGIGSERNHGAAQEPLRGGLLADSFHFGLFLQKVNLLKDQRYDETVGRFLIPSRQAVFESLKHNAKRGIEYILAIPKDFLGYRLFCSWSLFLGLASLPWIDEAWREKSDVKIPRTETQILLAQIESIITDNVALRQLYEALYFLLPDSMEGEPVTTAVADFPEFASLYTGVLYTGVLYDASPGGNEAISAQLRDLGLIP